MSLLSRRGCVGDRARTPPLHRGLGPCTPNHVTPDPCAHPGDQGGRGQGSSLLGSRLDALDAGHHLHGGAPARGGEMGGRYV